MNLFISRAALFVAFCVGLHLPRSYALLYLLTACIWLCTSSVVSPSALLLAIKKSIAFPRYTSLLLAIFSASYVVGMMGWQFWRWPDDALDIVNALLLPILLYQVGVKAASARRSWSTRVLLVYALGGLIYGLAALAVSRDPWWAIAQSFPHSIEVAWGSVDAINVRSIEQTAYPALLLLAPALLLFWDKQSARNCLFGVALIVVSALGAHVVWALNGRLGWLSLLLAIIPVILQLVRSAWTVLPERWNKYSLLFLFAVAGLTAVSQLRGSSGHRLNENAGWGQGFCDERFSFFGAMLMRLHQAPWGGRILKVPYALCGQESAAALLAVDGGSVVMAHNVFLEIYFSVGLIPVVVLLLALIPPFCRIGRGFWGAWPRWDWEVALRWTWVCLLACQWNFQPLLYSDGLLYYFSFFVLGLFAAEVRAGHWSARDGERSADLEAVEASA